MGRAVDANNKDDGSRMSGRENNDPRDVFNKGLVEELHESVIDEPSCPVHYDCSNTPIPPFLVCPR